MPHSELTRSRRRRWLSGVLIALVAAGLVLLYFKSDFDLQRLTHRIAEFNPVIVFALMATLPVGGFSVAVVYLVAGIKFGPVLGGVAVAGATAVHLLATHWICQTVLRAPLQRFLKRRKHELPHVPEGENVSVAAMAALVPGLPYFARNYLLALTDVPLRVYFWVCLPIYVIRSYLVILLGDLGTDLNAKTFSILATVYFLKLSICGYLLWRIRRRFKLASAAKHQTAG
ncbi:MAG: VTT domain-containing protein [Opitutus sp.]